MRPFMSTIHHAALRRALSVASLITFAAMPLAAQRPSATPPDYSAPADAPYRAEEVTVPTPMGHTLAGTLTLPKSASREQLVGAIVTISGSGPQDRDEYIGIPGYRPFRQIADSLGRRGIAVLRMDDRGVGGSKGTFKRATDEDFADDIRAGLAYLRTRPEIDAKRLGLLGHSEGSLIGPMVAATDTTLRALVLLAGVARPAMDAAESQLKNNIRHNSRLSAAQQDSAIALVPKTIDSLMASDPWWKFILTHDPVATARRVKKPAVLILTGANDQQADPTQVPANAAAFVEAGNRDVLAGIIPNVNHLFVYDLDGFPGNYGKLPPPVRMQPDVVGLVVDWLVKKL